MEIESQLNYKKKLGHTERFRHTHTQNLQYATNLRNVVEFEEWARSRRVREVRRWHDQEIRLDAHPPFSVAIETWLVTDVHANL